jgi:hypothetical protein
VVAGIDEVLMLMVARERGFDRLSGHAVIARDAIEVVADGLVILGQRLDRDPYPRSRAWASPGR